MRVHNISAKQYNSPLANKTARLLLKVLYKGIILDKVMVNLFLSLFYIEIQEVVWYNKIKLLERKPYI